MTESDRIRRIAEAAMGAEPLGSNPDAPIFHPDKQRAVDWAALAEDAGAVFDRAACEAHLAATYGGNPETLKTGRTRGRGPRSLPWGIIYRTMGRTERIFPLRLILEISK